MLVALTPRSYISAAANSTIRPLVTFPRRVIGSGIAGLAREVGDVRLAQVLPEAGASHETPYTTAQERRARGSRSRAAVNVGHGRQQQ